MPQQGYTLARLVGFANGRPVYGEGCCDEAGPSDSESGSGSGSGSDSGSGSGGGDWTPAETPCDVCDDGTPQFYVVELSGVSDGGEGSCCNDWNGTYTLESVGGCFWELEVVDPCNGNSITFRVLVESDVAQPPDGRLVFEIIEDFIGEATFRIFSFYVFVDPPAPEIKCLRWNEPLFIEVTSDQGCISPTTATISPA